MSTYGLCCNRQIVSRQWRYCPYCGTPMVRDGDVLRKHHLKPSYSDLCDEMDIAIEQLAIGAEDYAMLEKRIRDLRSKYGRIERENEELSRLLELAARHPLVTATEPVNTVRDGTVRTASEPIPPGPGSLLPGPSFCSHECRQGPNRGKFCGRAPEHRGKHKWAEWII